jgi:hypothetical protein
MSLESDLYTFLGGVDGGVYPIFAPEEAVAPYMTYRLLKTGREYDMDGCGNPVDRTYRITCWASAYIAACSMAATVVAAVHAPLPTTIPGVQAMQVVDETDCIEAMPELVEKQLYGRSIDLLLTVSE